MDKVIFTFIGSLAVNLACTIAWYRLLNEKINLKNYKFYLIVILLTFGSTAINFVIPQFLKLFSTVVMLFLINYIFMCRNVTKSLIVVLYSEVIIVASELAFTLIMALFMGKALDSFAMTNLGILCINFGVGLVTILFLKLKIIYRIFNYLVKTFNNMKKSNLMIYFVLTIAVISIFLIMVHMDLPLSFLIACDTVLTIFYIVMLFRLANARENYRTVTSKYETSLSSLREYEEIMDSYRVTNHENKNQLLTIRNMIDKQDKKTINYIDKLVDNKIKDNEKIFHSVSKIPEGGLRAIIYSKLCKMKEMDIKYHLDIAKDVKTADMLEMEEETILNVCKIIGVFLDNAIEAVINLKEKNIVVEIFVMDDCLCIDVSNNYSGMIEVRKLNNKGYTTKGKGHGYGLTLVEEITRNSDMLEHESEISKDWFKQRLKIKM